MVTPAQAREFASVLFHQRIGDDVVEFINDLASQVEILQAELAEKTCQDQSDMTLEQAMNLGKLWAAGKLIGGDAYAAAAVLASHMKSLQADAERYCWLVENAVIYASSFKHEGKDPASTKQPLDNAIDEAREQS